MTCRVTVVFREGFLVVALLWIDCQTRPMVNGKQIVNHVAVGDYLTHTKYIISKRDGSDGLTAPCMRQWLRSNIEQLLLI